MKNLYRYGKTNKEFQADRRNRAYALKCQFPNKEKVNGKNKYFLKNGELVERS